MGSFNTTCVVSKAPITRNQKARVFFLIMNTFNHHYNKRGTGFFAVTHQGSQCNSEDNFKVIGYPMLGVYKDYNHYEFEDKDMEALNLSIINEIYIPNKIQEGKTEEDYNNSHDFLNIDKIKDMKQLQDMEHSGALRVMSCHGVSIIVKMAILEDVFQKIIKNREIVLHSFSYNEKYYYNDYYQKLLNLVNDKKENIVDVNSKKIKHFLNKIKVKDENSDEYQTEYNDILNFFINEKLSEILNHRALQETYVSGNIKKYNNIVSKILSAYTDFIWVHDFFDHYKIEFAPVLLSGQDVDYKDIAKMLRELSYVVENIKTDYAEETLFIEREVKEKLYISLKELDNVFKSWQGEDDSSLKEYNQVIKEIKDKKIDSFDLNENSLISNFFINYNILDINKGIIYFKE